MTAPSHRSEASTQRYRERKAAETRRVSPLKADELQAVRDYQRALKGPSTKEAHNALMVLNEVLRGEP